MLEREDQTTDVHVMPNLPEDHPHAHRCSVACWCEPELNFVADNGNRVWLHRELQ